MSFVVTMGIICNIVKLWLPPSVDTNFSYTQNYSYFPPLYVTDVTNYIFIYCVAINIVMILLCIGCLNPVENRRGFANELTPRCLWALFPPHFHMPRFLPLPSTASQPNHVLFPEFWVRQDRNQSLGQPTDRPECCKQVLLGSFRPEGGSQVLGRFFLTVPSGRRWARVACSLPSWRWLGVRVVGIVCDWFPELLQSYFSQPVVYLMFLWESEGLGLPALASKVRFSVTCETVVSMQRHAQKSKMLVYLFSAKF